MSLATLRRRGAPVALLAYVTLLASTLPIRIAHADGGVALEEPVRGVARADVPPPSSTSKTSDGERTLTPAGGAATGSAGAIRATGATPSEPISLAGAPSVPQSLPVDGTGKTGVSSQAISLPQGTGKIQGMGESFSTQLSTGVANFTVPFTLVPARGGAQPSLSLSATAPGPATGSREWAGRSAFRSSRGRPIAASRVYQDPPAGGGWAPTQDRFIFNGGQELIPICLVTGTTCSAATARGRGDALLGERLAVLPAQRRGRVLALLLVTGPSHLARAVEDRHEHGARRAARRLWLNRTE